MYMSDEQSRELDARIRTLEKTTGVELVAAVVGKCDHYPEIPWKAFALGVSFSTLIMLLQTLLRPDWISAHTPLVQAVVVLGAGTVAALLTIAWPTWARCFLNGNRAEGEMRQYAQGLFLAHDLFKVPGRRSILVLVGLFEHRVEILTDRGVEARLADRAALPAVIDAMRPLLQKGDHFQALIEGLSVLEAQLQAAGFTPRGDDADRIPLTVLQEKGGADG